MHLSGTAGITFPAGEILTDGGANAANDIFEASGSTTQDKLSTLVTPTTVEYASISAMLASSARKGDIALVPSVRKTYILSTSDPSQIGNWKEVVAGGGATGGSGNFVFYENQQVITADYTITTGYNAMCAGPVTLDNGVTVTLPTGSTFTVV